MAYCGKCGTQLSDGANFCPKCGNPCGNSSSQPTEEVSVAGQSKKNKSVKVILATGLAICIIGGGLLIWQKYGNEKAEDNVLQEKEELVLQEKKELPVEINQEEMKQYSKENIEKDFIVFLSKCINTDYEGMLSSLSDDFNDVITKCDSAYLEHNIFGLNSSATIQNYHILSLSDIKENRVTAHIKLGIDNEGDFYEKEFSVYLILEREQWVVDEIGVVKQELKTALEEGIE